MQPNSQNHKHKPKQQITKKIALTAIMAALTTVATFIIQIPVPATGGYLNFGDIIIFVTALTFGPTVGGFAGGIGSALSDVLSGYAFTFAPATLVIKGFEGAIAGAISNQRQIWRDILAVTIAGAEMVTGYFLAEFFPLHIGWAAATEIPGNIVQVVVGAIIGVPIALILRRSLPKGWTKMARPKKAI